MTMQSPEILLTSLNSAMRRLRGACTVLGDEEIDDKLLSVMRRLLLAEILGNTWIVAIGGSQGAGKTTLMASMYDLRGEGPQWLHGNEGRGEKMPVLVEEADGLDKPQGYVRRLVADEFSNSFKLEDVQVDEPEFQKAVCDPNVEDLLPVLRVPRRYFKRSHQAWLLLPGYEKQERANRSWQELMRQAMIGAGGCIIVTDETRMANQQQLEIVKDMLQNELRNCKPYIVISKTEAYRHDENRCADLRASAQAIFQIDAELAEKNIILSGVDDPDYVEEWMPRLRDAIDDLNFTGQSNRYLQISHLSSIVGKDLNYVLNDIRSKSLLYFATDMGGTGESAQVIEEVLEKFDDAVALLRDEHHKGVSKFLGDVFDKASKKMRGSLRENHEGFMNWVVGAFDTTTEKNEKMHSLVQKSWEEVSPNYFDDYSKSLKGLTEKQLGKLSKEMMLNDSQKVLSLDRAKKLIELGYVHESGEIVKYSRLNKEKVSDIRILLGNSSQEEEQAQQDASKQLGSSVALLPAIALEYTRLAFHVPQIRALESDDSVPHGSSPNLVAEGVASVQAGVDLGKTAIKAMAAALAVDVVSDGDSDILSILLGAGAPGDGKTLPAGVPVLMHPAAIAATAVVAAAYVTTAAITGLRERERQASVQAHSMLLSVRDHHIAYWKEHFDNTMSAVRERIQEKLRERYRLDEALMKKDRLAAALANAKSITDDLLYELNTSPNGLQPFLPNGAA